ncbi:MULTISPECIES: hypothetical protein [unclassified Arthrobacter]|uniref:hypothetical protein n=1 Tax=unclassified Arthrobacter TaxID=235627 RepID=UPI00159E61DD|nr:MULTISPECIES: hypothetical protein [unclassified Arthrobacter]MCQ9162873.1 hypothetical protein [Arthrobacter sp. STN4]NVM98947.1 hypothetical protein [Arthrobacter sp. SDTb3-6]
MQTRHVGNNWVPLLCLSILFLAGAAASMVALSGNGAVPGVFAVGIVPAGCVAAPWLWRHPSWWIAPRKHYLYLAGGTLAGVLLLALVPFLHGCGPWLVLGGAVGTYGYFERLRLLVTTGGGVVLTGFLALAIHADVWGGGLQLLAAAALAFAANRLFVLRHGRRREVQDSDPGFIGRFEEFDVDAPPNFWERR